jgi:hypothetical protein
MCKAFNLLEPISNDDLIKAIEANDPRFNQFGFFNPHPNTWNPDELAAGTDAPELENHLH